MIKRFLITAIVVLALISLIAPATYAVPTLQLVDIGSGATVTIPDNMPGLDGNPIVGVVNYQGPVEILPGVGTWQVNITTGITKPVLGDPIQVKMDLHSVNVTSQGQGTLQVMFSEDNFGPGSGSFEAQIGGTLSSIAGSWLTYDTYYDTANIIFGKEGTITSQGPFPPGAFSGTTTGSVGYLNGNGYSLTQEVIVYHAGNDSTSFDAVLRSVPEPSFILLLGSLLIGLGLLDRKRYIK